MILFTIIIPVLNRQDFISRSIKSILNQSFKNYEILVVDNGSTDGTLEILKDFERINQIRLFTCESKGVSFARNVGINNAKGTIVHILDSDNYFKDSESLKNLKDVIDNIKEPWQVILTSNLNDKGISISWSNVYNRLINEIEYLNTRGEFSITAKRDWYQKNLHPEIEGVTHEIIFPAFFMAAKENILYISNSNIQTYSEEAPDRLSSKSLTYQQIHNYKHYYKYSLEVIYPYLPLAKKIMLMNKFYIYNKISGNKLKLNIVSGYKFFNIFYYLIPNSIILKVVKKMRG